jgi:hypothetical protein
MTYKHGDLQRGPDGKVVIFDQDYHRQPGRFVKRLHSPEGHEGDVGTGWRMEPAEGLDAEIAAANGMTSSSDKPIPISELVASGAIKPASKPVPMASAMSRTQPGTPYANDAHGRAMARLARAAVDTSTATQPRIDVAAIYESRQQRSPETASAWDETIRRAKENNAAMSPPRTNSRRPAISVDAIYTERRR